MPLGYREWKRNTALGLTLLSAPSRVLNVQNSWETSYVAHSLKNEFKIKKIKKKSIWFGLVQVTVSLIL